MNRYVLKNRDDEFYSTSVRGSWGEFKDAFLFPTLSEAKQRRGYIPRVHRAQVITLDISLGVVIE